MQYIDKIDLNLKIFLGENMKQILLVNNQSLNQQKFLKQNALLLDSAKELNCKLDVKTNFEVCNLLLKQKLKHYDAVLFYDKDIILAKQLEVMGFKLFNCSDAILNCDNKALTEICLCKFALPRPKTVVIPLSFYYNKNDYGKFVENLVSNLHLPLICKEWYGSWGEQVFKLNSVEEIENMIVSHQGKQLLFQEFVEECSGQDVRMNVVDGKVVACMKRFSVNGDFRANLSNGGQMEKYTPTKQEIELALAAAKSVGCDFCGVDILQSKNGPLVCEVNSNAHLLSIFKCTGENVAKDILNYILTQI